jgi:valyl-tRNA synthetase
MISEFPVYKEEFVFAEDEEKTERIIAAIKAIRARRAEMNVPPSKKAKVYAVTKHADVFANSGIFFEKLAGASELILTDSYEDENAINIITDSASFYIPMSDVIDFEKERARLNSEMAKNDAEIERIEKKLANESFVAKAPAAVIDGERAKLEKYKATKEALIAALAKLA